MKKFLIAFLFVVLPLSVYPQYKQYNFDHVRIGIVADGESESNSRVYKLLSEEIISLLAGQSQVVFPEDKMLIGDWSMAEVIRLNDKLLSDNKVDVVIAMGVLASYDMCRRSSLSKPVIAPFIINHNLEGIPFTSSGTSGIRNLCYLDLSEDIEADLKMMRRVYHFTNLAYIRNKTYTQELTPAELNIEEIDTLRNMKIQYIELGSTDEDIVNVLKNLPGNTDAVYVSANYQLKKEQRQMLYDELNKKNLPSFSFDFGDVSLGALASIYPDVYPKLSRRIALNLQDILLGIPAANLPVRFIINRGYFVNINTFYKIGIKEVNWDVLMESQLIGLDVKDPEAKLLTVKDVMKLALDSNTELMGQKLEISKSETDVTTSKSKLLPFVGLQSQALLTRESMFQPERLWNAAVSFNQNIYSNLDWSEFNAQKSFLESQKNDYFSKQLNLNNTSASAFINVILGRKLFFIAINFLTSARSNLEISKFRKETGKADQSEVYRWESEVANARKSVMNVYSSVSKAVFNLQQVTHMNETRYYALSDLTIEDEGLLTSKEGFLKYFEDPIKVEKLSAFFVNEGLINSPLIKKYDLQIEAQKTIANGLWVSNFMPVFSAFGSYSRVFFQSEIQFPLQSYDYQLGLKLTLPLFSGFSVSAAEQKAKYEISQLDLAKKTLMEKLTLNIRSVMSNLQADNYAIKQTGIAKQSAGSSLDLVNNKYLRGASSLLDLLDAQRNYYNTLQDEANAYYTFLNDYFQLQNAISKYDLFLTPAELNDFYSRIQIYMNK